MHACHRLLCITLQENELYYLGRSLRSICPEEPSYSLRKESDHEAVNVDEDDIYDRISRNSDIMDQEILVSKLMFNGTACDCNYNPSSIKS